jgi:uncharacterized protein YacL
METLIELLTTNKFLVILLILIISAMIYYLPKGVFKITIILAIALLLYYLYINFNEKKNFDFIHQDLDQTAKEFKLDEKKEKANIIFDFYKIIIKD